MDDIAQGDEHEDDDVHMEVNALISFIAVATDLLLITERFLALAKAMYPEMVAKAHPTQLKLPATSSEPPPVGPTLTP